MMVHGFGSWIISWAHGSRSTACPESVRATTTRVRLSFAIQRRAQTRSQLVKKAIQYNLFDMNKRLSGIAFIKTKKT